MESDLNVNLKQDQWELIIDAIGHYLIPRDGINPPDTLKEMGLDALDVINSELDKVRG